MEIIFPQSVKTPYSRISSVRPNLKTIVINKFWNNNLQVNNSQIQRLLAIQNDTQNESGSNSGSGSITQPDLVTSPLSIGLESISTESQFDQVLAQAQQLEESVVVLWMASWCRKCIYLKPKLEKLAADYYPRVRFYSIDVNSVPHKLVVRAEVTKMPTIQLWRDGKKQSEVIGGHKAYLVVNEIREMIENGNNI